MPPSHRATVSDPIAGATVVVRGGKIVAAGTRALRCRRASPTIDGTGKWVTPGLFAGDDRHRPRTMSMRSTRATIVGAGQLAVQRRARHRPGAQPAGRSSSRSTARAGVTRAVGRAGCRQFDLRRAGRGDRPRAPTDPLIKPRAFQHVELGEAGAGLAGGSRAAAYVLLRNALAEASDLAPRVERNDDALLTRPDAAALIPVVTGAQPLLRPCRARGRYPLGASGSRPIIPSSTSVLVGATEGWMVAPDIAAAKVPVIARALNDLPAQFEQLAATQSNIGRHGRGRGQGRDRAL